MPDSGGEFCHVRGRFARRARIGAPVSRRDRFRPQVNLRIPRIYSARPHRFPSGFRRRVRPRVINRARRRAPPARRGAGRTGRGHHRHRGGRRPAAGVPDGRAGLGRDQRPGRVVPVVQAPLVVGVHPVGGDGAQVNRGRAVPPDVADQRQQRGRQDLALRPSAAPPCRPKARSRRAPGQAAPRARSGAETRPARTSAVSGCPGLNEGRQRALGARARATRPRGQLRRTPARRPRRGRR